MSELTRHWASTFTLLKVAGHEAAGIPSREAWEGESGYRAVCVVLSSEAEAALKAKQNALIDMTGIATRAQSALKAKDEEIARLRDALGEYGVHQFQCLLSQWHAGRPTGDGRYEMKYGDKWYRDDKKPPCTCGLSAALDEGKEVKK